MSSFTQNLVSCNCILLVLIVIKIINGHHFVDRCSFKKSCGDCIQTESCSWCTDIYYNNKPRCFQSNLDRSCKKRYGYPYFDEAINWSRLLTSDGGKLRFTDKKSTSTSLEHGLLYHNVEKIKLQLRLNYKFQLNLEYSPSSDDLPIDIIEIRDNSTDPVQITYKFYSNCLNGGNLTSTNKCIEVQAGDIIRFVAEIVVTSCPSKINEWKQIFQIFPVASEENLIVELDMICNCQCEIPGNSLYEVKSDKCYNHGTFKCGVCECEENYFGSECECLSKEVNYNDFNNGCREDNSTIIDCSLRGICICGVCECDKRDDPNEFISGKYCECDNFSCDRYNGLICSNHGICNCGICECLQGWKGLACECLDSNSKCLPPNGSGICSEHGYCLCGSCKCFPTDGYSGRYCENRI